MMLDSKIVLYSKYFPKYPRGLSVSYPTNRSWTARRARRVRLASGYVTFLVLILSSPSVKLKRFDFAGRLTWRRERAATRAKRAPTELSRTTSAHRSASASRGRAGSPASAPSARTSSTAPAMYDRTLVLSTRTKLRCAVLNSRQL